MNLLVIKKFKNRKLYNTQTHSYINLTDLRELIVKNQDVIVISNETKREVTKEVLTEIAKNDLLNNSLIDGTDLHQFIRKGML